MPSGSGLVAAGPPSVLSTPNSDRGHKRDHLFPQLANPSPGSPHPTPSSTSTSFKSISSTASATLTASQQSVTADGLLKKYIFTAYPKLAALEHAVDDRNVLADQNVQLWNLIEQQRAGFGRILKEVERIRAKCDNYKTKLVALTGSAEGSSEKQHKSCVEGYQI